MMGADQGHGMYFSQLGAGQQQECVTVNYPFLRSKFQEKISRKVGDLHGLTGEEDEDDFDLGAFSKSWQ